MAQSAEILCIGTELLLGQIINTNATYLATELARLGIPHHYQTVVGDNAERIGQALDIAVRRSGLIITTGGLGPTADDLSHAALAAYFGVPMVEHPEILAHIEALYRERNRPMSALNAKQAQLPTGAAVLANPVGTAPGILWQPQPGVVVLTFPGVPAEMKAMWYSGAVPFLRDLGWGLEVFYSRVLRHWGISESTLAEKVGTYFERQNPTVAPYANFGEVKLRITARAPDSETARALIEPVERELRNLAGLDCYGADDDSLTSVVGAQLARRGETLAVAESCTGGLLSEMITSIPGASKYFVGGIVAYTNDLKLALLEVLYESLLEHGSVSAAIASEMAEGVRRKLGSDWGLAITGISGPGGATESKPVGLVFIALAGVDSTQVSQLHLGAQRGRDWIRKISSQSALDLLRRQIARLEASGIMEKQPN